MKDIQISDHFDYSTIILFSLPTIGMVIVDNTYMIADGFFISNYIGSDALAAQSLIFPPFQFLASIGLMFGTGASAIASREMGAGNTDRACGIMSMLMMVLVLLAITLAGLVYTHIPVLAEFLGATESLMPLCVTYGEVLAVCIPSLILTMTLQILLITAEHPGLGFATTAVQAVVNILLEWLFLAQFGWGLRWAAVATGIAWMLGMIVPLVYFFNKNNNLHFKSPIHELKALGEAVYNGASELVDSTSFAIVAMIFNLTLMKYLGATGVAAYAVSVYVMGLFLAMLIGIYMSMVPVVGYHFGAGNQEELSSLLRKGVILVGGIGILMTVTSACLAEVIADIFVGYDASLWELATEAVRFMSFIYLFIGITFYVSAYFTGLGQGTLSLIISVSNSLVFPLIMVNVLPLFFGYKGIWMADPMAQFLALTTVVPGCMVWWKRKSRK